MRSKDIVSDLALLEHRSEDQARITMPWRSKPHKVSHHQEEDSRDGPEYGGRHLHRDSQDLQHSNNSSFRHGQSGDLHHIPEDDNEDTAKMISLQRVTFQQQKVDENSEYEKMKRKFIGSLNDQKNRINQSVSQSRIRKSDQNFKKQIILNNIRNLRNGDVVPFSRVKEISTVIEQSELSDEILTRNYNVGYGLPKKNYQDYLPKPVYRRRLVPVLQPEPSYTFNTKTMTQKAKLKEYEDIRKWKKENDFLKDSKSKAIKVNQDQQEILNLSKLQNKKANLSKFNNESQRMVISKISAVDNKVEMETFKLKCGAVNPQKQVQKEDGYIDSIRMKMQIINGLLRT